jgi:hypothetical protein
MAELNDSQTRRLIDYIKLHPEIYDKEEEDHKNTDKIDMLYSTFLERPENVDIKSMYNGNSYNFITPTIDEIHQRIKDYQMYSGHTLELFKKSCLQVPLYI